MKNSYELAMERFGGGPLKKLTDVQKEKISEIESLYKSKTAEAQLSAQEKNFKAAGDVQTLDQIREDLTVELASIRSKLEKEKEKIRNENK